MRASLHSFSHHSAFNRVCEQLRESENMKKVFPSVTSRIDYRTCPTYSALGIPYKHMFHMQKLEGLPAFSVSGIAEHWTMLRPAELQHRLKTHLGLQLSMACRVVQDQKSCPRFKNTGKAVKHCSNWHHALENS